MKPLNRSRLFAATTLLGAAILAAVFVSGRPASAGDTATGISQVKLSFRGDPATSIAVSWRDASTAAAGRVQVIPASAGDFSTCGTAGSACQEVSATRNLIASPDSPTYAFYQASVQGLQPASSYRYRVTDGSVPSAEYTLKTAAGGDQPFTAAAVGEVHVGDKVQPGWPSPAFAPVAEQIRTSESSFVLSTGDNVDTGAKEGEWERVFGAAPQLFGSLPYMTAVGNHETYGSFSDGVPQQPFFAQFPQPTNGPDQNGRTYSFDYNGVHFAVIEANPTTKPAQFRSEVAWLEDDLAAAARRTRFQVVVDHAPPFHSKTSRVTPTYENPEFRELLVPLMDRYGVELMISGHDKHYVRSYPLNGKPEPGSVPSIGPSVVKPGRGTTYMELTSTGQFYSDFLQQDWMEKAVPKTAAFLKLRFGAETIDAQAVQPDGNVIDAFQVPQVRAEAPQGHAARR